MRWTKIKENLESAGLSKVLIITIPKSTALKGKFINIFAYEARQTTKANNNIKLNENYQKSKPSKSKYEPRGFDITNGLWE